MSRLRVGYATVAIAALLGALLIQPGVASAIEPTAICSKVQSECSEENLYPVATKLTGTSTNLNITTESLGTLKCESSKVEGATTADYGYSLPVEVSALSFTGCKISSLTCTVKALNTPYTGWLEKTGGEGSFEVVEETGSGVALEINCGVVTCTYATEPAFSFNPSSALQLAASGVLLEEGGACGEAELSGSYAVKTGGGANVFAVENATPPVKLLPKTPPARPPLKIGLGKTEEITIKSERPYNLLILVNGPAGNFELKPPPASNCGAPPAVLNAFASCKDTVGPIAGAAKGDKGRLNVTVERPGFIPPAVQNVAYRLLAN